MPWHLLMEDMEPDQKKPRFLLKKTENDPIFYDIGQEPIGQEPFGQEPIGQFLPPLLVSC